MDAFFLLGICFSYVGRPLQDLHIWWTTRQVRSLDDKVDKLRSQLEAFEKNKKEMSGSAFVTFKETNFLKGAVMEAGFGAQKIVKYHTCFHSNEPGHLETCN